MFPIFKQSELVYVHGDKGQVFYVALSDMRQGEPYYILEDIDDQSTINLDGIDERFMSKYELPVKYTVDVNGYIHATSRDLATNRRFSDVKLSYNRISMVCTKDQFDQWYDEFLKSKEVREGTKVIGIHISSVKHAKEG